MSEEAASDTKPVMRQDASTGEMALFVNNLADATGTDNTPWDSTGVFVVGHGFTSGAATNFAHASISSRRVLKQRYSRPLSRSCPKAAA